MKSNCIVKSDIDAKIWDEFVRSNDGSFYQLFGWSRIYQNIFGFTTDYIGFYENNSLLTIIPFAKRGKLFPQWVSLPYVDYGGFVGEKGINGGIVKKLHDKLGDYQIFTKTIVTGGKALIVSEIFEMVLPKTYSQCITNCYHHKTRNVVRKAYKNGINTKIVKPDPEIVDKFYYLYLTTMKKLGTFAQSKEYFRAVANEFYQHIFISVSSVGDNAKSFVWCFQLNKKVYIWANATDESSLGLGVNYAAYDLSIQEAFKFKCKKIIFGASDPMSPQAFFKRRWGAIGQPIYSISNATTTRIKIRNQRGSIGILISNIIKLLPINLYKIICKLAITYF